MLIAIRRHIATASLRRARERAAYCRAVQAQAAKSVQYHEDAERRAITSLHHLVSRLHYVAMYETSRLAIMARKAAP